jgi:hypothetical protein
MYLTALNFLDLLNVVKHKRALQLLELAQDLGH